MPLLNSLNFLVASAISTDSNAMTIAWRSLALIFLLILA